ncbi:MAG: dipeptide ABC transporter ATP-binding protein [Candidatus Eiseniibacteriota bacterium]|jgi:oligopeptide/dipeptide ABC transporter ATP-binding protein
MESEPIVSESILTVERLTKFYPVRGGILSRKTGDVRAVVDVSFELRKGETLGLVGESGCGKSTLGRTVMRLEEPTSGAVLYEGRDLARASKQDFFRLRRNLQMIFQDPYASLNPRMPIGEIVREPLDIYRIGSPAEREAHVDRLLGAVGLEPEVRIRYPHEFSGGQRQRVGVARALALNPEIIIADEPVSALDVSVQAQVLNLMVELQRQFELTYIFISHDLSVVEYISDRIAIMYLGRIVEEGQKATIFERPTHPYTRALIESAPIADPRQRRTFVPVEGETPSPIRPPAGCAFHPRCRFAIPECRDGVPPLEPLSGEPADPTHRVACIRKHEI